jgi:hypothetical protein
MNAKHAANRTATPVPTAPSAMQRWFPIGSWLPDHDWGKHLTADLIAAVSVAALLIPEDSIDLGYGCHVRHQLAISALLVRLDALFEALSEGVGVESSVLRFSLEVASDVGGVDSRFPQQIPDVVQVPALESLHHTPELLGRRLRQAMGSNRRRLWLVVIAVQQRAACVPLDDQLVCQDVELDDPGPRSPFRSNEFDT